MVDHRPRTANRITILPSISRHAGILPGSTLTKSVVSARSSARPCPRVRWCAREANASEASATSSTAIIVIIVVPPGNIVALLTAIPVLLVTRLTVRVLPGALTPWFGGVPQVNLVAFGLRIAFANHLPVHELATFAALALEGKLFQRLKGKRKWLNTLSKTM